MAFPFLAAAVLLGVFSCPGKGGVTPAGGGVRFAPCAAVPPPSLPPPGDEPTPSGLPFPPPSAEAVAEAPSFRRGERIVAAHYFYWYRYPGEHFDSLRLHFPGEKNVSYTSKEWHRRQFEDMTAAGVDVALPVYWGCVDHYDRRGVAFSVKGIPAMAAALDEIERAGGKAPRIGLFYDTTTLQSDVRGEAPAGGRADLRTAEGRDLFYRTIRDFFCQVPPRHWACIEGKPVVVLYAAGFAGGFDQAAFDEVKERFRRDFYGRVPHVIRDSSWAGVVTDGVCTWGAALWGPRIGMGTVQIGPGYDDSPVKGRRTPIREREGGRFYEKSWRAALRSGRDMVLVETWNEQHEGTSICETVEFGRKYIDLTRRYADLFKARKTVEGGIALEYPEPRPRPDRSWGREAEGKEEVRFAAGSGAGIGPPGDEGGGAGPLAEGGEGGGAGSESGGGAGGRVRGGPGWRAFGLRPVAQPDGPFVTRLGNGGAGRRRAARGEERGPAGRGAGAAAAGGVATPGARKGEGAPAVVVTAGAKPGKVTYLYFQVSDFFAFDDNGDYMLVIEARDTGRGAVAVQYDSRDEKAPLRGAYKEAGRFGRTGSGEWIEKSFLLLGARLANRQNGGSDFRLAVFGGDLEVRRVVLTKRGRSGGQKRGGQ